MRPRLCELTTPTLVLHGTEDPLSPYGHAEALAAEIPGPNSCRWKEWATRCRRARSGIVVAAILDHSG